MRKIVNESGNCVWFLAPSNSDYEEVDINELIELPLNERYITLYVYNLYYNCKEPYDGCHIHKSSEIHKLIETAKAA